MAHRPLTGPGSGQFPPDAPRRPLIDRFAFDLASRVLACLCETLESTLGGPVCRCCLYPGEEIVPMDYCCGCNGGSGMAAVRVYRIAPTTARFPQQDFSPRANCSHNAYIVSLELTVYRCFSTIDDNGDPPSCENLTLDTAITLDDAAAIRHMLRCCVAPQLSDGSLPYTSTGRYVEDDLNFIGPAGDCGGVRQRIHVEVFDDCGCEFPDPL